MVRTLIQFTDRDLIHWTEVVAPAFTMYACATVKDAYIEVHEYTTLFSYFFPVLRLFIAQNRVDIKAKHLKKLGQAILRQRQRRKDETMGRLTQNVLDYAAAATAK